MQPGGTLSNGHLKKWNGDRALIKFAMCLLRARVIFRALYIFRIQNKTKQTQSHTIPKSIYKHTGTLHKHTHTLHTDTTHVICVLCSKEFSKRIWPEINCKLDMSVVVWCRCRVFVRVYSWRALTATAAAQSGPIIKKTKAQIYNNKRLGPGAKSDSYMRFFCLAKRSHSRVLPDEEEHKFSTV